MKFSQQFFSNRFFEQDNAKLELVDLARKACFIHQDAAGLYSWLSLGLRAQRCVERIVREEMEYAGFCEVQLSLSQDADLWRRSGRFDAYGAEMMRFANRSGRLLCLGATCEELATQMVKTHYNRTDMALALYQFGNKYRDELRTRVRTGEGQGVHHERRLHVQRHGSRRPCDVWDRARGVRPHPRAARAGGDRDVERQRRDRRSGLGGISCPQRTGRG